MSLLMKALEKAAKDRVDARTEPAAPEPVATPAAKSELTLEPLTAEAPAPAARAEAPARAAAVSREQTQAAAVLQAGGGAARGGAVTYVRDHPIMVFGVVAVLIAIGFGTYVYLQVFHPGMFNQQPPVAPRPPVSPIAQAPAPGPAVPAPTPESGGLPPAAPLLQEPAAEPPPPPPPPAPARAKPAAEPAPAPAVQPPRSTIVVSRGSATPAINPLMNEAYGAFQANRLEDAQRAYGQLLRAEPRNVDALLGLAAIATLEGRNDEASRRYMQVLELDPRHVLAQSALIGMIGRADPLAAEARLKHLIAREPSAFLYFTLGNLYADQSQWAAAQQAYFQAYHLEPNNPDYAYNLAVGLEHVSQPKLALGFYRRAVQLAGTPGRAHFNLAQAQERIGKLASQVE
jgi:Tfp pilus assembly protein PilF